MNHTRFVLLALLCCFAASGLSTGAAMAQVKHFDLNSTDRFVSCVQAVFGKPVLVDYGVVEIPSPCHPGDSVESLTRALRAENTLVSVGPTFVYLTPLRMFKEYFGSEDRPVVITWSPSAGKFQPPGCVSPRQEEVEKIGQVVFREARMPFFSAGLNEVATKEGPVKGTLRLVLYDCQLKPGTQSILGVLGGRRLIYGEMKNGQFKLLWDSPDWGHYGYLADLKDVNGDGTKEILVTWQEGGGVSLEGFAIFDIGGNELDPLSGPYLGEHAFVGDDVEFESQADGKVDVLVENEGRTKRYALVNGRYALVKPAKGAPAKPRAQPHQP